MTKQQIKEFLDSYKIKNYNINTDNLTVDVDGDVDLRFVLIEKEEYLASVINRLEQIPTPTTQNRRVEYLHRHHNIATPPHYRSNGIIHPNILLQYQHNKESINKIIDEIRKIRNEINETNRLNQKPKLSIIPFKFGSVAGSFSCRDNNLTNFHNFPSHIGRNIYCENNKIINFKGFPIRFSGVLSCGTYDYHDETIDFKYNPIWTFLRIGYNFKYSNVKIDNDLIDRFIRNSIDYGVIAEDKINRERLKEALYSTFVVSYKNINKKYLEQKISEYSDNLDKVTDRVKLRKLGEYTIV